MNQDAICVLMLIKMEFWKYFDTDAFDEFHSLTLWFLSLLMYCHYGQPLLSSVNKDNIVWYPFYIDISFTFNH